EFQLRTDAVQIALDAHQLDFQPVVRASWMSIAIEPVGALRAGPGIFCADTIFDHQIKEPIVVVVRPGSSLVSRSIVLELKAFGHGDVGESSVAVIVKKVTGIVVGIVPAIGDKQVKVTVVVVVSPNCRPGISRNPNSGLIGYLGKGSIPIISIQTGLG